ncbi:hypothetical protein NL676_026030 [Syzygium grande]|nr:hypothetical protein NL676_026030 [Syzygium grande]
MRSPSPSRKRDRHEDEARSNPLFSSPELSFAAAEQSGARADASRSKISHILWLSTRLSPTALLACLKCGIC